MIWNNTDTQVTVTSYSVHSLKYLTAAKAESCRYFHIYGVRLGITWAAPSLGDTDIYMKEGRQKIRTTEKSETQQGKDK
jgi:hypothetical protein